MGIAPVVICFFLSGLASLVLEVVWTRHLRLVFGSTTLAASTILVAYMLGLGIGGLVGGRIAKRLRDGVRTYGWIEIVIAAYALAVPSLLSALPELNRSLLQSLDFWPAALARFGISLALLLLPTFLMGATLPVLVEALTRASRAWAASPRCSTVRSVPERSRCSRAPRSIRTRSGGWFWPMRVLATWSSQRIS